jgi:hypothetical protein
MPDSFPPLMWGPPPFEERDLDALLSGDMAETPVALRQVADALTALRAEPAQAELSGEAAARAEFRALSESLGLDEAARTDGHPYAEVLSALALGAGRPSARHRIIRGAGGGPGRAARRHSAGPPGRPIGRRGAVWMAASVAAVLVVAVFIVTGSLPGPIHPLGHSSAAGAQSGGPPHASPSPSQNVQVGSATPVPSHKATPTHPASASSSRTSTHPPNPLARALCHTFYENFSHLQPQGWQAEKSLYSEIANLAGNPVHFDVSSYCASYVRDIYPNGPPLTPFGQTGSQGNSGGGSQGNSQHGPGQTQQANPPA